jgi:hypothetical protein
LEIRHGLVDRLGAAESLEGLGSLVWERGAPESATRLLGLAEALREEIGAPIPPGRRAEHEHTLNALRSELRNGRFDALYSDGRLMQFEQIPALVSRLANNLA